MKKYFSILYCLAALAAGCDDNNKEALAFDLSTDEWSFAKEGGTQNLIVLAPGVWKVSEKPDWCTLIPEVPKDRGKSRSTARPIPEKSARERLC